MLAGRGWKARVRHAEEQIGFRLSLRPPVSVSLTTRTLRRAVAGANQLFDRRRQPGGQPGVDVSRLFKEEACCTCEGSMKIGQFQRDDQRICEKIGLLRG